MFGGYRKNAYLCSTRTPKPLYNAQIGGRFFICTMAVNFDKSYTSPESIIGIISKAGRYGGTYAHKDIAFEFAMLISPNFNPLEFDGIKKTMC